MTDEKKTKKQLLEETDLLRKEVDRLKRKGRKDDRPPLSQAPISDQVFPTVFSDSPDVLVIIDVDTRTILRANPATQRILKYDPEALVGQHFSILFPLRSEPSREDALGDIRVYGAVFEAQDLVCADGSVLPTDLTATLIPWNGGTAMLATFRDVSDRERARSELKKAHDELERRVEERTAELAATNKRLRLEIRERVKAEEAAKENEERLRAIFETVPDCIFIKDKDLKYTLVNPSMENLLQLPLPEIIGRTDEELFGEEVGEHSKAVELRVLRGEFIEEEHTRTVKGSAATFLDVKAPMRSQAGEIVGICGICRNITERSRSHKWPVKVSEEYTSATMRSTMAVARLAAQSDSIILLTGESGSGKDFLAQFIHDHSKRAGGPFFAINCAAVPPDLAESELFGHERGAYTGAHARSRGLLELAEGGTLLLNEIGDLTPALQAKLLTFLDTRTFTRVGGRKNVSVNARIMAATNRDLEQDVASSKFRADLFYRLNVLSIRIPPLRERLEDLPVLVEQILPEISAELHLPVIPQVGPRIHKQLAAYHWPGNVRELRNVLERALIVSKGERIELPATYSDSDKADWSFELRFPTSQSLNEVTRNVKRSLIEEALRRSGGSRKIASQLLNISRHALHRQMKSLEIAQEEDEDDS